MAADPVIEPPSQLVSPLPWQQPAWLRLIDQHRQQRLAHALLLGGESGLGKAQFAKAFGQYLLCLHPVDQDGMAQLCGQCKSCLLNTQGTHPDLVVIEPEATGKAIKVDQIRALIDTVTSSAQQGGYRVIVLGPAEAMNNNAANALLKVLEEPGQKTLFALYSHLPGRVSATVRSRCQTVPMALPEQQQALDWLAQQPNFDADPFEQLRVAGGAPLAALQQATNGSADQRKGLYQALKLMATAGGSSTQAAEKLSKSPSLELLDWWLTLVQDMIRYQATTDPDRINTQTAKNMVIAMSQRLQSQQMFEFADRIQQYRQFLMSRNNPNPRLMLEDLLIDWSALFKQR